MKYSAKNDITYTISNLNNTKIEFNLRDADVKKEKAFDWDFFEDLFGAELEEEGGNR